MYVFLHKKIYLLLTRVATEIARALVPSMQNYQGEGGTTVQLGEIVEYVVDFVKFAKKEVKKGNMDARKA